jgi:AraC-like DNA-binding protein
MLENIEYEELLTVDLSPRVINCQYLDIFRFNPNGKKLVPRYSCDYEIELITRSEGGINIVDGQEYHVEEGDLIFRRPGLYLEGWLGYCCYSFRFNPSGKMNEDPPDFKITRHKPLQKILTENITMSFPYLFKPLDPSPYKVVFKKVLQQFISTSETREIRMKSLVLQLLCMLHEDIQKTGLQWDALHENHIKSVKNAVKFIENNSTFKLTLEDIAHTCGYHPHHFHKIFRQVMNTTPLSFLANYRLEKAKELLLFQGMSVGEVACQCGFDSISYFSYFFRKYTGMSPRAFRKKHGWSDYSY